MGAIQVAGVAGLTPAGVLTPAQWSLPGALLDLDFAGGRHYYAGRHFASEASALAACGGTRSGDTVTIGPWDVPGAPEQLVNGDFSAGVSGWTVYNGGTASIDAAGHCRFEGNGGAYPVLARPMELTKGRAYRLRAWVSDGYPLPGAHVLSVGSHPTLAGTVSLTIAGKVGGGFVLNEQRYSTFSAPADTVHVGMREIASPATGTAYYDDLSVKEVLPCSGFAQGGFSAVIAATTPPVAAGNKVLFQADDDGVEWPYRTPVENNRVRLVWDAARHLRLIVTETDQNGPAEQANLDLGVIAVATAFEVVLSVARNAFRVALRGGPVIVDYSGDMPGLAAIRLGRSASGELWGGAIRRVSIIPRPLGEAEFLETAASRTSVVAWGDSLTAGAGASPGHGYPALAQAGFSPPRSVVALGSGGQTSTQIAARQGGIALTLSVSGNQIPASGGVAVTTRDPDVLTDAGYHVGTMRGTLVGVRGTLSTDAGGNWTFTRDASGAPVACPAGSALIPEMALAMRDRTSWLWLGRNGAGPGRTVAADLAAAVSFLGHGRYLVAAVLPAAGDSMSTLSGLAALNAQLAGTYGSRFVDVLSILQAAHNGSPDDLADVGAGLVPRSLRSDAIHLNDAGYAVVAAAMVSATTAFGW